MSLLDLFEPPKIQVSQARRVNLAPDEGRVKPRYRQKSPDAHRKHSRNFRLRHGVKLNLKRRIAARYKRIERLKLEIEQLQRQLEAA